MHLLYADDLQVYTQITIDELNEGIRRLSIIGRAVSVWATNNARSLNVNKTKVIISGSSHNINILLSMHLSGIEIQDNVFVPFVDTVTNLGVVMDSKVTGKRKWMQLAEGLTEPYTDIRLRRQLANSFVLSHLYYCSLVYHDV